MVCGVVCDEVQKRGWHERNSHLSGLAVYNDCRFDRVSQIPGTKRGNTRKPQRALHNTTVLTQACTTQSSSKATLRSKKQIRSQSRRTGCPMSTVVLPSRHWGQFSLRRKRKPYDRPKTSCDRSAREARVWIQGSEGFFPGDRRTHPT